MGSSARFSLASLHARKPHVGRNEVHLGGHAAHQLSLASAVPMVAALDVSTNGSASTGIEPWWTYEAGMLPGVGKYMVNVGTGNLVVQSDDVDIPEPGIDLAFRRTYNSQSSHDYAGDDGVQSNYGEQWTNTFDAHLGFDGTNMVLFDVDGASCTFKPDGSGGWIPCAGYAGTSLTLDIHSCGYLWTKKNGTRYHFFPPNNNCTINGNTGLEGRLYEIVARNNTDYIHFKYAAQSGYSLTYDRLATITATHANGDVLTLTFADFTCNIGSAQRGVCRELSTITRPDGRNITYSYTQYGRPTLVTRPLNTVASISEQYDYSNGMLYDVQSPNNVDGVSGTTGNTTSFTLDGSGNVGAVTDTGTVNFTPADGTGIVLQAGYSTGARQWRNQTFTYDNAPGGPDCVATGQACTYSADTDGHATKWQIDGKSRVASINQWAANSQMWLATSMNWENTNNDLLYTIDANGQETDYAYDDSGNTVEVAQPLVNGSRPISTYSYSTDGFNNLTAFCDPAYNTGLSWNTAQVGASDSKCAGGAGAANFTYNTTSYDPFGDLTSITSKGGYKRTIVYYASSSGMSAGLPSQVTGAAISGDNNRTPTQTFAYNTDGLLTSYNPGNGAWTLGYDVTHMHRLVTRTDADGATWHFCYDWDGRLWYSETPYQYVLDQGGTCASPGSGSVPANAVSFVVDNDGNVTSETHHHGVGTFPDVTNKFYDGDDRLVEVIEPKKAAQDTTDIYSFGWGTRYIYDLSQSNANPPAGSKAVYTNASGSKTLTGHGNMVKSEELLPSNPVVTWINNPSFLLSNAQWTDTKANNFDTLDRPTDKFTTVYTGGAETILDEALAYDKAPVNAPHPQSGDLPVGHLGSDCIGNECKYLFYIDPRGVNTREDFSGSKTPMRTKTYDNDGRLATNTSTVSSETYTYNADSQLTKIAYGGGGSIQYGYYRDGTRQSVGGSTIGSNAFTYSYRTDGLLMSETIALPLNGSGQITYQRSAAGRPTKRTDVESGDAGQVTTLTYDPALGQQLSGESFPGGGGYSGMQYSPEGELVSYNKGSGTQNLTYNSRGELISGGGVLKNYYANGVVVVSCPNTPTSVCGTQFVGAQWDAVMGAVLMNANSGVNTSVPPQCQPSCPTTLVSQITYDALGRNTQSVNCTMLNSLALSPCSGTNLWTSNSTTRTYDVENHVISASGNTTQLGNSLASAGASYQWGVNGHPVSMNTSGSGTSQSQTGSESLFWDGDSLLYTLAGSALDDVKIGNLGDFTPSDPGYKGITFWDRGPGGSVSYCHNATGTAGNGDIDPYISQGKWGGGIVNPCFPSIGGTSSMPSQIVWNASWSGQKTNSGGVPVVGAGWIIGEMRADGINDGVDTIQGVRAYDPNAAQWTTPDAFAGNVHDPMSQKSYMWNGNSPMQYADLNGYDPVPAVDILTPGSPFPQDSMPNDVAYGRILDEHNASALGQVLAQQDNVPNKVAVKPGSQEGRAEVDYPLLVENKEGQPIVGIFQLQEHVTSLVGGEPQTTERDPPWGENPNFYDRVGWTTLPDEDSVIYSTQRFTVLMNGSDHPYQLSTELLHIAVFQGGRMTVNMDITLIP